MAIYLGIGNNGVFVTSDGYKLQDSTGATLIAAPSEDKWNIIIDNIVYQVNVNLGLRGDE